MAAVVLGEIDGKTFPLLKVSRRHLSIDRPKKGQVGSNSNNFPGASTIVQSTARNNIKGGDIGRPNAENRLPTIVIKLCLGRRR